MAAHRLLTLMALMSGLIHAGAAQSVEAYRDRLVRLNDTWEAARMAADSADRLLAFRTPMDTIVTGSLVGLNAGGKTPLIRRGMEQAWEHLAQALGPDTMLLNNVAFLFPAYGMRVGKAEFQGREVRLLRIQSSRAATYARRVRADVSKLLTDRTDTAFADWLGRTIPVDPEPPDYAQIRPEFDATASFLVRDCAEGGLRACRIALGIDTTTDWVHEWYDAQGRATVVANSPRLTGRDIEARSVCVDRRWDQVCVAILQTARPILPLSNSARESLLRHALRSGGHGAYRRLVNGLRGRTAAEVIAEVGGADVEQLIGRWVDRVLEAPMETARLPMRSGITSLLWIAVVLGAAMRNRSWR